MKLIMDQYQYISYQTKTVVGILFTFLLYWQHAVIKYCHSKMLSKAFKYWTITPLLARNYHIFSLFSFSAMMKDYAHANNIFL